MDKYHRSNPPTELKSVVMGRENSRKKSSISSPCSPWTMEELEEIIAHAELHSNYPRSGFDQMTTRQKEIFEAVWRRNVEKADLEENSGVNVRP